jgi:actin
LAGRDLTEYLRELLKERNLNFQTPSELEIVRDIKETMCHVVNDYEQAMKEVQDNSHAHEKNYELPDGRKIVIGAERFKCAELLFKPKNGGH